jgi:benzodiazapine receptor
MSPSSYAPIAFAALAAIVVAGLGASMTDLGPWYQALRKPSWQPPDWLFGPAWTLIFACAAVSAATAWRDAPTNATREWVVGLFALNGILNVLWSFLFFRAQRPDWALIEVAALWLSIIGLIVFTFRFSRWASLLLVPYIAWVTFAAILNWAVVTLNPIG